MAINTYSLLKQALQNWSHRTDINDIIDDVIHLAENDIDKRLLLRTNEQRATATMPTTDRFLVLPAGFLKMRRLTLINGSLNYEISYKAPEQMRVNNTAGKPRYYTITSEIEFDRVPDSAYTLEMSYFAKTTALTSTNTTNDVLTDYPDLYLYGCLLQIAMWEKDTESMMMYQSKFDMAMDLANKQERQGRYGTAPRIMKEGSTP